jgi:polyphosphate kinase
MPRNFDRRIEVVAPVKDPRIKKYLVDEVLNIYLRDNVKARQLLSDGRYVRIKVDPGEAKLNSQKYFIGT